MTLERDPPRTRRRASRTPPALAPGVTAAARQSTAGAAGAVSRAACTRAAPARPGHGAGRLGDLRDRVLETFGLRNVEIMSSRSLPEAGFDARRLHLGSGVMLRGRAGASPGLRGTERARQAGRERRGAAEVGRDITLVYEPRTVEARTGMRKRVIVSVLRGESSGTSWAR